MTLVFKVVLIGDSGVGKTSVLRRLLGEQFDPTFISTTPGETIKKKRMEIQGQNILLEIWDAPGNEAYRTHSASYLKDTKCALVFFDLSKEESFENIDHWIKLVENAENAHCTSKIIIGNKMDKTRCVKKEEAEHKAEQLHTNYFETSARNDTTEAFKNMFETIVLDLLKNLTLSSSGSRTAGQNLRTEHSWRNKCILL